MIRLTRRSLGARLGAGLGAGLAALAVSPARAAGHVRIGYQKNGTLVILRQQRRLEAQGIGVEWVEFNSGPPLLEALNAGAVDFAATGDTPPIFAQAAGADLVYVGAQPLPGTNQALLVRRDGPVQAVADLRGKRVAFTKGSSAHNFILRALATAKLSLSDVQPVYLQPPDAAAAFRSGALDAWSIWDPFYAIAEQDSATRVLTTAQGVAPSNSFFLASTRYAAQQPETIVALLRTINEAAAWAAANPEPLAVALSAVTGVPLPAQRVSAARGTYAVQPLDPAIVAQQQAIADSFAALRIIPAKVDVQAAVWRREWQQAEVLP